MAQFWHNFFIDDTDNVEKLNLFTLPHILLLLITVLVAVLLYRYRERLRRRKHKKTFCYIMAGIFFLNMLALYLFFICKGVYSWKLHLPLHLCYISGYLFMYVLITGNQKLFQAVYFFTWVGPLPAMIWPNTPTRLDRFLSYQFFISHHLLLLMGLYCLFVLEYKIERKNIWHAFLLGNIIFAVIFIFNQICDTNYIMTNTLPPHVIELFPFLQYLNIPLLWLELCGVIMMLVAYLPAALINRKQNSVNER